VIARRSLSAFCTSLSCSFETLSEELFPHPRLSETHDDGELSSVSSGDACFGVLNADPEPLPPPRLSGTHDEGESNSIPSGGACFGVLIPDPEPLPPPRLSETHDEGE